MNRALSAANSCLYGICHAAILSVGYSPALGFIHTGKQLSFVYDIADLFKFETVVPHAFRIASKSPPDLERQVRYACRDSFRQTHLLEHIIPTIEAILAAGELPRPEAPQDTLPPALPNPPSVGDAGHRA